MPILSMLWCKPALDSLFLMYADCSGTMTGHSAELFRSMHHLLQGLCYPRNEALVLPSAP